MTSTCGNCRYWHYDKIADPHQTTLSQCRRLPPHDYKWSMTWANDWCGEFQEVPFTVVDADHTDWKTPGGITIVNQ